MRLTDVLKEALKEADDWKPLVDREPYWVKQHKAWIQYAKGDSPPRSVGSWETVVTKFISKLIKSSERPAFFKEYYSAILVKLDQELEKGGDYERTVALVNREERTDSTLFSQALKKFPNLALPKTQILKDIETILSQFKLQRFERYVGSHPEYPRIVFTVDTQETKLIRAPETWIGEASGRWPQAGKIIGRDNLAIYRFASFEDGGAWRINLEIEHLDNSKIFDVAKEVKQLLESLGIEESGEDEPY